MVLVRRKYNRGRRVREQWVFWLRYLFNKKSIVRTVPYRKKNFNPHYTWICWILYHYIHRWCSFYDCLTKYGYIHKKCNHSIVQFVNYENNANVNHADSLWQKIKQESKKRFGTHRATLDSHVYHFLLNKVYNMSFEFFIRDIKEEYPISVNIC